MYLVNGAWVELGAQLHPEQVRSLLESAVLPSLEMLKGWEQEGKIQGGILAGERETTFILHAGSAEEVGELLPSLPFWGMMKWDVRPLQSFASTVTREQALMTRIGSQGAG